MILPDPRPHLLLSSSLAPAYAGGLAGCGGGRPWGCCGSMHLRESDCDGFCRLSGGDDVASEYGAGRRRNECLHRRPVRVAAPPRGGGVGSGRPVPGPPGARPSRQSTPRARWGQPRRPWFSAGGRRVPSCISAHHRGCRLENRALSSRALGRAPRRQIKLRPPTRRRRSPPDSS